jgi:hypothetical protein
MAKLSLFSGDHLSSTRGIIRRLVVGEPRKVMVALVQRAGMWHAKLCSYLEHSAAIFTIEQRTGSRRRSGDKPIIQEITQEWLGSGS